MVPRRIDHESTRRAGFWGPIKADWADGSAEHRAALHPFVEARATREQYETGVSDRSLLDPTAWMVGEIGLDRPGTREIQMDLFHDYRTNVALCPRFQAFFREHRRVGHFALETHGEEIARHIETLFPSRRAARRRAPAG